MRSVKEASWYEVEFYQLSDDEINKYYEAGYTGKAYLALTAGAANFNKYARSNFAALLQETMLTSVSPVSLNFKEVDGETFWAACPNKDIQVGTEAVNEYTMKFGPISARDVSDDASGWTWVKGPWPWEGEK